MISGVVGHEAQFLGLLTNQTCIVERMKIVDTIRLCKRVTLVAVLAMAVPCAKAQLTVDSFDGPVTKTEIGSFRSFVQTLTPPSSNRGNAWSQGRGHGR